MRFVASTWFRSVLESNTVVNQLPYGIYKFGMEANIQRLLEKSTVRVAFAADQPDEILGYCIIDTGTPNLRHAPQGPMCHHVYVKSMYRRQGDCELLSRSWGGRVRIRLHVTQQAARDALAPVHRLHVDVVTHRSLRCVA